MYFLMERTWNSCDNFLLKDRSSDVFFERRLNAAAFGLRNLFIFHVEKSKYLSISAEVPGSYIEKFSGTQEIRWDQKLLVPGNWNRSSGPGSRIRTDVLPPLS